MPVESPDFSTLIETTPSGDVRRSGYRSRRLNRPILGLIGELLES
jgi:hypothetical protein